MRSYIFTGRERELLTEWITKGKRAETLDMIIHRIRHFNNLEKDVELYIVVKEKLRQASSTR